uniref:Uncharacterized protein n=1 Tax=Panagrolaimus sp. ES5 TaxID=591445 RepID=A0AC34GUI5_9BILA
MALVLEFHRNPPIFTSTLSFEQLPPFPSTHFTHLTSDVTRQLLRTEFFENHRLPQAIWIFSDNNLRTGPCCEIETALTPTMYHELTTPNEPSSPSFTPPESLTFEYSQPTQYTESIPQYPTITVTFPQITEDPVNDYFSGWGVTVPPSTETYFTKDKSQSEIFTGKLNAKKLISNQIDQRIIGPPSIQPPSSSSTTMGNDYGSDKNGFMEQEAKKSTLKIGPPSTAPNEFQLKNLNEKEQNTQSIGNGDYGETNNIVTDYGTTKMPKSSSNEKQMNSTTDSSTKEELKVNNVLMGIPKGTSIEVF